MSDDFVDSILDGEVSGDFQEVGAEVLQEVGFAPAEASKIAKAMKARLLPRLASKSPSFERSPRNTVRRAPLGLKEDGTGAAFFSLAAAIGSTTVMRGKVSRRYHGDRLLIVPSAPGVVIMSLKVGDEEQLAAPGCPVELYGTEAMTDSKPDNFSPLATGVDMEIMLMNTTAGAITGTCGLKGAVER